MKVAAREKFHLMGEGGNQDPGDPGVGKVRGGRIFFLQVGGEGTDPGWHFDIIENVKTRGHVKNVWNLPWTRNGGSQLVHANKVSSILQWQF